MSGSYHGMRNTPSKMKFSFNGFPGDGDETDEYKELIENL